MRLISAIYEGGHPFFTWDVFKTLKSTSDPSELRKGDALVMWGGGDISPSLYNKPLSMFGYGSVEPGHRDKIEWALMHAAVALDIPIIGVCRGGQMLTALAGGHLIQHVHGHAGATHEVTTNDNHKFIVNSIHHQMMIPPNDGTPFEVVGKSTDPLSDVYWDVDDKGTNVQVDIDIEPEFIYYPTLKGFAIQWHPEGMSGNCEATRYLKDFIIGKL